MSGYSHTVGRVVYRFENLKSLLAKASPLRSGDQLAGLAAATAEERVAAQMALSELPLRAFLSEQVVPCESDEVTRLIVADHDADAFGPVSHLTVGDFRNWLLADTTDAGALAAVAAGLAPAAGPGAARRRSPRCWRRTRTRRCFGSRPPARWPMPETRR